MIYSDRLGCENQVGAAASLWERGVKKKMLHYHLGTLEEHTVYEVELVGVILGLHLLNGRTRSCQKGFLGLDNQAVIRCLVNHQAKAGHYLLDIIHSLAEDFLVREL